MDKINWGKWPAELQTYRAWFVESNRRDPETLLELAYYLDHERSCGMFADRHAVNGIYQLAAKDAVTNDASSGEVRYFDDRFGLCPICHRNDGYTNAGRSHWFFCKEHQKKWCGGINLFSSCREETEAEQRALFDKIGLGNFEEIKPSFPPLQF
jgi:hypothetical protein